MTRGGVSATEALIIVGVIAGALYLSRKGVTEASAAIAKAATDAAREAASGVVLGIGDSLGIPRTNDDECRRALAEGRWWDASKFCPATDFVEGTIMHRSETPMPPAQAEQSPEWNEMTPLEQARYYP